MIHPHFLRPATGKRIDFPKYKTGPRRQRAWSRLLLEYLEDRTAPAVFAWVGAGTDNNWFDAANWQEIPDNTGGVPQTAADTAIFADGDSGNVGGGGGLVNVDMPVTIGSITLENSGTPFTIAGNMISLASGSLTQSSLLQSGPANNTITAPLAIASPATAINFDIAVGTTLTMNGVVSGTGDLDKVDSGTLVLGGVNVYTGGTSVEAGTLKLGSTSAVIPIPPGAVAYYSFDDVTNGSPVTVNNDGTGIAPAAPSALNGNLVGTAAITANGELGSGLAFTSDNSSRMEVAADIPLGSNWTGSAWFNGLMPQGDWRTLFRSPITNHQVIIEDGSWELGSYINGFQPAISLANPGQPFSIPTSMQPGSANYDGLWHNITAVGTGGTTTFYLDGVAVAVENMESTESVFSIGAYQGGGQVFANAIDEVRIYQTALDAGQVADLAGTGVPASTNPIPDTSTVTVATTATFDLAGFSETIGDLAGAGIVTNSGSGKATLTINEVGTGTTFSGTIETTIAVDKTGSGTLTLTTPQTYTRETILQGGTLQLAGGDNTLPTTTAVTISATAVLDLDGTNQTLAGLTGSGSVVNSLAASPITTLTDIFNGRTDTFAGVLGIPGENAINLTKSGSGTLVLGGNNDYSGVTSVTGGALSVSSDANLGAVPTTFTANDITLSNGATLVATASFALNLNRGITLGAGGGAIAPTSNAALTYSAVFTGGTGLKITGPGAVILLNTPAGTAIGPLEVAAGRLFFGAQNDIGTGSILVDANASLLYTGTSALSLSSNAVTLAAGSNIVSRNAPLTTSAVLMTSASLNLIVNDDNVNDSTVVITTDIPLSANLTIQVGNGGGNGGLADLEGMISGGFGLTKIGTGLLLLGNGANSFTGTLNINDGTVRVDQNGALGDIAGPTIVASGATLQFAGGVAYTDLEPVTLLNTIGGANIANLSGASSFAGPIDTTTASYTPFTGPEPGQGLDLAGNFVDAIDVDGPAETIGDATFVPLSSQTGVAITTPTNNIPNWQVPNFGPTADDTALSSVMSSIHYNRDVTVALNGLTADTTYKLQLLFYDAGSISPNRHFDVYVDGTLLAHDLATGTATNVGEVFTYSFTTTDSQTSASVLLSGDSATPGGDPTPVLDALTLEQLSAPENEPGNINIASSSGTLSLTGQINLHNSSVTVSGAGNVSLAGNVIGTGTGLIFTQGGSGTTTLSGANTYTGATMVAAGTLVAASTSALGDATDMTDGTTVAAGASLLFAGNIDYTFPEIVNVIGSGAGGGSVGNLSGSNTFAGSIQVSTPQVTTGTFNGGDPGNGLDLTGDFLYAVKVDDSPADTPSVVGDATFVSNQDEIGASIISSSSIENWQTPNFLGGATVATTNDTNLDTVLQSIRWGNGNDLDPNEISVNLTGLVPGTAYKLQLLTYASGTGRTSNVYFDNMLLVPNYNGGNQGGVLTYDFIATATSDTILMNGNAATTGSEHDPVLQAFTLQQNTGFQGGSGTVSLSASAGSLTLSGPVDLGANGANVSGNGLTISGNVAGTGTGTALTKTGTGTVVLSGNNSYAGVTLVSAGTLVVASTNALGATSAGTTIASGATLAFSGGVSVGPEPVTVIQSTTPVADEIVNLSGVNTFSGPIGQVLPIAGAGSVGIGSSSGTLTIAGNITLDGLSLVIDGAGNTTITGNVVGATVDQPSFAQTVLANVPSVSAYWQLDDPAGSTTGTDSSGNGFGLTYVNPTPSEFGNPGALAGDTGTAITLNGTNQYATIPSGAFDFPSSGQTSSVTQTFETWFNTTATTTGVILAVTSVVTPGVGTNNNPGGYVPALYLDPNGQVHASVFWHGGTGAPVNQIVTPGSYNDGKWHNIVDVFNNGTETLYVDGVQVGTPLASRQEESFGNGSYSFFLGTGFATGWPSATNGWDYFNGSLDDTAVFSTALSPAAIGTLAGFHATGPIDSSFSLTKNGSGTLTLAGTNSYAGITSVSAGSLLVNGSLSSSTVSITGTGILGGTGTVDNVTNSGIINPGSTGSPGILNVAGNLTLEPGTLVLDLAAAGSDSINIPNNTSSVDINGATLSLNVSTITPGESFTILSLQSGGSVSGFFNGLSGDNSTMTVGSLTFTIHYNVTGSDGTDDVTLTASGIVPTLVNGSPTLNGNGGGFVNITTAGVTTNTFVPG